MTLISSMYQHNKNGKKKKKGDFLCVLRAVARIGKKPNLLCRVRERKKRAPAHNDFGSGKEGRGKGGKRRGFYVSP